ncbi:MAG: hypothetical protein MZW92_68560 [Comamonadaceae bacterium]|nr:hypothetical protein [Comamonadaceae bacterium]
MSPSEAENSSSRQHLGPEDHAAPGSGAGAWLRAMSTMTSSRRRRSMIIGETLPPPLPRTSTISASLRSCG